MKIVSAREAANLLKTGMTVATEGFLGIQVADEIFLGIRERFLEEGLPRDLTLFHIASQGDFSNEKGLCRLAEEGLLKRVIGAHFNTMPKLRDMLSENKIEGFNLPQGVISHMMRDIAAHKPGTITHVGLKTFVDPRLEGAKVNQKARDSGYDPVELIHLGGKEYLWYKPVRPDACILRGSYADERGNISFEKEVATLSTVSVAQATRNSGGIVIVQVERIVGAGTLDPKLVKIPGIYVDYVVVARPENHRQTYAVDYDPAFTGHIRVPVSSIPPLKLDERKVIARRAAMELVPRAVVNLGVGMPEGVAIVATEEGIAHHMNLTVESGPVGGVPAGGGSFGAATNPEAILDQGYQFDFYDGGGIDVAFLGIGQCDAKGNINVSRFGTRSPGCGGFINITQNSKKVVFCGNFTAGGVQLEIGNGKLTIRKEGKVHKFIPAVEQITFSGEYAKEVAQPVVYITERAVFEMKPEGFALTEIAPGIDLQKDVLDQMDFQPIIAKELKRMDERIFREEKMGITLI
ncbi:propionate CoA-transferase [Papillibacter cinnamivorans DSM 12816]|uniref:Propionate CoA-transferase n=1 Tax=Papillibacter cinnamivorans DSM 12816 TaxID=1122930 RepID=A0A1W1YQ67_9FIRM|nr:malonate decarboxylase subunit alpha [Papillibacter cinnamivorans]SMC37941.1 propionate CoA-transferase [Papillibacter cinnamivorans DSM 12816]